MMRCSNLAEQAGVPHGYSLLTAARAAGIIAVLLLAGCVSAPPAPVRVEIPVFTPCVKVVPQRPAYEFDQLAPAATDGEIVLALARDWPRGRKYEGELEAVVAGCG